MNGIANQLHKKPIDCGYGSKVREVGNGLRFDTLLKEEISNNEQLMVSAKKVQEWNNNMDEFLNAYPNNQSYKMLKIAFIDLGLRKES